MKLRIRPQGIRARRVRVIRPVSGADVVLALFFSMLFVTVGLVSFSMLCWQVGSETGALVGFPVLEGFFSQRYAWLCLAVAACLFAKLIDSFIRHVKSASTSKSAGASADEVPADGLRQFLIAPE